MTISIFSIATRKNYFFILIVMATLLLSAVFSQKAFATHVRAGDLTAVRISDVSLTYRITAVIYTDDAGVPPDAEVEFNFGTGETALVARSAFRSIGNETTRNEYVTTYTFPGPGEYEVGVGIRNRNEGIVNVPNSVNTAFFIESTFLINPFLGLNAAPILLVPPIDFARVGEKFVHNPGAYDPDGDSLAYRFVIPKRGDGANVEGFSTLDDPAFGGEREEGGAAIATLDPITGDLVWNTPGRTGEFNVAFIVEEWRDGVLIGQVNRDMQIFVRDNPNKRPILEIPRDTCITAGAFLRDTITGRDPDLDLVNLTSFSALYEVEGLIQVPPRNYATFDVLGLQPPNGEEKGVFEWQTVCEDVRLQPYAVTFKAEDVPNPSPNRNKLVDLKTWQIRVVGPKPDTIIAEYNEADMSILVSWFNYQCPNASEMTIWRREGGFEFNPDTCETGLPSYTGYTQIGSNSIDNTFFLDASELERGKTYCYRIFARFPNPAGGESYVSDEVCVTIPINAPYITNVSVEETSTDSGEIFVRWTRPLDLDATEFPRPYTYTLARANGFSGTQSWTQLGGIFTENDTTFTDTGLNTEDNVYNYRVYFYSDDNLIDSSTVASSVRLSGASQANAAQLTWTAQVPWNNTSNEFPYHYIYRNIPSQNSDFVLLDSINVFSGALSYTDTGLDDKTEYCYYVTTQGAYADERLPKPLLNNSQIVCLRPLDEEAPCSPLALNIDIGLGDLGCENINFNDPRFCEQELFENRLVWNANYDPNCEQDVASYNVYFSAREGDTLQFLLNTRDTFAIHEQVRSIAGCYAISAVDGSGNESDLSNVVCVDNCPNYELPNVFTPNGDNVNDTFRPFDCPAFVNTVETKIYSRWGQLVYEGDQDIFINWEGTNTNGTDLPSGVYYYEVKVRFNRLRAEDEYITLKGWVTLLRDK